MNQQLRMLRAQQTLSLCFVVDATGSMHMGSIFKGVCQTIRSIIGELQASIAGMCFELSCVAYRDVCTRSYRHYNNGVKVYETTMILGKSTRTDDANARGEGNWFCPDCNNENWPIRIKCNRCHKERGDVNLANFQQPMASFGCCKN